MLLSQAPRWLGAQPGENTHALPSGPCPFQGFWTRLTVHEPQPAGDLERGWHGKLGKMKAFAVKLMAAAGIDQLSPAVLLVAQHSLLCTLPILVLAAATERLQRGSRQRGTVQR